MSAPLTTAQQQLAASAFDMVEWIAQHIARRRKMREFLDEFRSRAAWHLVYAARLYDQSLGVPWRPFAFKCITRALVGWWPSADTLRLIKADSLGHATNVPDREHPDLILWEPSTWEQILALLKPDERRVVESRILGGRRVRETAAELGITPNSAERIFGKALRRLRGVELAELPAEVREAMAEW